MDTVGSPDVLLFGQFRFDRRGGGLSRRSADGTFEAVTLGSRAVAVLGVLVERAGVLVPKDEIMRAVWPGTTVEDANLTVQISALRRALDAGRPGASCILNVPGRGYRFLPEVSRLADDAASPVGVPASEQPGAGAPAPPRWWSNKWYALGAAACAAMLMALAGLASGFIRPLAAPPRLSVAVLPFTTVGDEPELARLADALGEDLATDLGQLTGRPAASYQAALRLKSQSADAQTIGRSLRVRYVVEGSLHPIGTGLRANVALLSGETGAALWMDQFDVDASERNAAHDGLEGWLRDTVYPEILKSDAARNARERPDHPDALDLIIQARALRQQPASSARFDQARALVERAAQLEPNSPEALAGLAAVILAGGVEGDKVLDVTDIARAETLVAKAESLAPTQWRVLEARALLLRAEQRWPEAEAAYQRVVDTSPHLSADVFMLGLCRLHLGRAGEAIPVFEASIRDGRANRDPWWRYYSMGQAVELAGRYAEAVSWFQRGLAANPEVPASALASERYWLASAYALAGNVGRAREVLAEADARRTWWSARSFMVGFYANAAFAAQLDRVREGLRLAGVRDHDDEEEDGPPATTSLLPTDLGGRATPSTIPGARTVRTAEMPDLLRVPGTVVIDATPGSPSIPGAVSFGWFGGGASLSDHLQPLVSKALQGVTAGDVTRPIVVLGFSAHSAWAYNLALRAVASGHRNVMWYRGGRDSWGAAGLPLAAVTRLPLPTD